MATKARGTEVGVGYVSIVPSARDFARKLESEINPKALGRGIGKKLDQGVEEGLGKDPVGGRIKASAAGATSHLDSMLGGMKKVAVGAAAMGGALFLAGKSAFEAYSDQSEAITKAQQVFGDAFARVDAVAQGAAKSMGLSRTQALDTAATFGNLFRAMGIGTDTAADMSLSLEQLAGDLASFNNTDPEDALLALRSGLVGEIEPLRRYGVNLNQARIEAEAMRLGLVKNQIVSSEVTDATNALERAQVAQNKALKANGPTSLEYRTASAAVETAQNRLNKAMAGHKVELDAAQKAQAAYSLIMKDTAIAQGDYARTADGAANKQRTLSAEWDNFKARVGEKLAPLGTAVLGGLETSLTWLSDWWNNNGDKVIEGLGKVKQWFLDTFGPDPVANFQAGADIIRGKFEELFGPDPVASYQAGIKLINDEWDRLFDEFETGAALIYEKIGPAWETFGGWLIWFKDHALDPLWGNLQKLPEVFGNVVEQFERLLDVVGKLGEPLGWVLDKLSDFVGGKDIHIPGTGPGMAPEGHALGGVVGGVVGAPRLIEAHGGETVLPTHQAALAGLRGVTGAEVAAALAPAAPGPLVGSLTVTGQSDPAGSAWAMRRELRRVAFYGGMAYAG